MGVIRAEISMSQPANVIYTHKKFKRTSSQSWKDGSAESAALPCSAAEGPQRASEAAASDERNFWAAQERDGAESLLFAASLVEQRDAGERLQGLVSSESCVINGARSDALRCSDAAPVRGVWSCSYCKFSATHEDEVRLHEAQHSRLCASCRAPEVACYCDQLSARQSRPPPSSSLGVFPSTNCQFTASSHKLMQPGKHPAGSSITSTKSSNNMYPNDGYSQREFHPSSHDVTNSTAAGKTIYKPKFRVSYSLDEPSSLISCSSTASTCDDVFEVSEAKPNVPMPFNLVSTSDFKSTTSLSRHEMLPAVRGDEPGTALRLGSIVGTGLWKGIKSPSPDLGEHIDKLIDQNKLIMDSDNPLRNRKYRRQSSIGGSSSSENENSSGMRSRRTSATDSAKCKVSAITTLPNRVRVQNLIDVPVGQASVAVPPEAHASIAYKRSVSALGQSSGPSLPNLKFSAAAQIVPSNHLTPADLKRFLSVDNSLSAQTAVPLVPSSSLDREVYVQQILSNPDSDAQKILVARGGTHGLQGTSIIPVVNPQLLILVCPNCSASFRTRESLEVHLNRHCSARVDNFSTEKNNPSLSRTFLVNRNDPLQESAIDLQKRGEIRDFLSAQMRSSSVENEPRVKNLIEDTSQGRGSSLGADVRLNVDHIMSPFRSTSPYTRQQLRDTSLHPNKKRKLSSETQPSCDFSVTSVHPVLVHNGVVVQRARVSVKAVDDSKRPSNKNQLCGGEVKICDGTEYKTMRIDTSDCNRNLALDMCLTSAGGLEVKNERESRSPTSHNIVTLSKSGLNCGGTMVESRVSCLSTSSSVSPATRRDSSCSDTSDTQSNFAGQKTSLKFNGKDVDLPSISLSNLQQYAPQLQLPNLSIPGVPIPNISGVMLSKLSSSQPSIMKPKRNPSFNDHAKTNYACSLANSNGKASYKNPNDPTLISVGKEKVPYVPGIPGPYSQSSTNLAMNTSLTSPKSGPIFSTIPLTSFKPEQPTDEKSHLDPSRGILSNLSAPKNSLIVPTKADLPFASSFPHASSEQLPASDKLSIPVTVADQKDIFLAPRKRPDTLPLKPHQFVSKSTAQLIGSTIMSPDTPRPKKSCAQLLLDGSAYTYLGLKVSTKTYYCCIYRPQPMYVPQSPDSKISMYSNWQIRKPAEDNPFNLSISESMGLYSSRRYTDTAYSVAKPSTTLIYTYSNDKIIEAFAQITKQEKSATTLLSLPGSDKKLGTGGSPCKSSKVVDGVGDVKIEDLRTQVTASNSSREPSDDSRFSSTSSRVRICDGGFKSTEEYTYVRGRGRGRYVCETCGIRCKKPSMLKKHIRTHTNFRPYPCTLCTSRFKTKGNLTKHLKSKAHYKKCLQHGLPHDPPTSGGEDASTEMDYDDDEDDDDDDDGDEDDDEEDDDCEDDPRESRENSSMRDSSRENSYFRDSSRENSYANESREGSCFRDSRENSYVRESRENSYLGESRENSYLRDSRENSYVRDSRENSYVGESRENSCIPESRENSCIRDGSLEKNFVPSNGGGSEKNKEGFGDVASLCLSLASIPGRPQKFMPVEDTGMDLRVSSVACRSVAQAEVQHTTAADDAPIDLSFKKSFHDPSPKSDHGLFSSLLSRGVSCTKNVSASRPNFLPVGPSNSGVSLVSTLPVKSPITPIREQPADILSPVTESSMLLKSIYNTTERASRASSVLLNQASYSSSSPQSQASGVMMKAYLTERAIQDTFIKRHQYQGFVSFADTGRDTGLSTIHSEPAIIQKIVPKTEQMRLPTASDIAPRNAVINVPGDLQPTQMSSLLKPKNYYGGKLLGNRLPLSPVYSAQPSDVIQVSSKPLANQHFPVCDASAGSSAPSFELSKSSCSTAFASYPSLDGVLVDDATFKGKLRAAFDLVEASDKKRASSLDDLCEHKEFADSSGKFFKNVSARAVNVTVGVPCAIPKKAHIMAASRVTMPSTATTHGTSQHTVTSHIPISHTPISRLSPQDSHFVTESVSKSSFSSHSVDSSRADIPSDPIQRVDVVSSSSANQPKYFNSSLVSQRPISSSTNGVSTSHKKMTNSPTVASTLASVATVPSSCAVVARGAHPTQPHVFAGAKLTSSELSPLSTPPPSQPVVLPETSIRSSPIVSVVSTSILPSTSSVSNSPSVTISAPTSIRSDIPRQETVSASPSQASPLAVTASLSSSSLTTASRTQTVSVPSSSSAVAQRSVTVPAPSSSGVGGPRSLTVPAPSSAMNLTVLNNSDSKSGTSFLSPSGVVPNPATNRSAPEDGRCRCYICQKEFARSSQLSLHMNIHYMERPFRCDSCSVSFRTSGHLQKHKRSASHFNKVNMNLTFGAASTDNPRPFKCDECKIAFRIHGHLAKHLRSKMHILRLECVAKLPFGLYAEMERTGYPLANIDTTDCEHSLLSLQGLADKLFAKEPEKLVAWRKAAAAIAKAKKNKNRPRSVSGSSCNSDEYPLADDQDDPSPLPDSGDENDSSPSSRGGGDSMSSPSRSPQSPAPLSFTAPPNSNSTSCVTSSTAGLVGKMLLNCPADSLQPVTTAPNTAATAALAVTSAKSTSASPEMLSFPSTYGLGASSSPVPAAQVSVKSPHSVHTSSPPAAKSRTSSLSPASVHSASA